MTYSADPAHADSNTVRPDIDLMKLIDDPQDQETPSDALEESDDNAAAAEQVEEDEESTDVAQAARRDRLVADTIDGGQGPTQARIA